MLFVLKGVSICFSKFKYHKIKKPFLYHFLSETMDHSHEFDNVKAEKAIAMRRYRRHRNFKWIFAAFAAVFLLSQSSSWFPIATNFIGDCFREIVAIFKSHFFVFMLFNIIILAVYVLSGFTPINNAGSEPDLYDEFVSNSEFSRSIIAGGGSPGPEKTIPDKITDFSENAGSPPPVRNRNVVTIENVSAPSPIVDKFCTEERENALVVKSYRRTQSARFEQSRREFRRSCTDICHKLKSVEEPARGSGLVNESDEEFNRKVDAFIATQKLIQREEFKEDRNGYMALTVCQ